MADLDTTELIDAALRVLGVVDPGETPGTTERNNGLEAMRIMLRMWSAKGLFVFVSTEDTHTLTAGTQSYTIGSGADIDTTRPVSINESTYVSYGNIDRKLKIIGEAEYGRIQQKGLGFSYPSALFYLPGYSIGTIYLWPPGGGTLHLWSKKPLTDPTALGQDVTFPGEYDAAITYPLAVHMAPEFRIQPSPVVVSLANDAMNTIVNINAALSVETVDLRVLEPRGAYHIDAG